jgi:hypothetical protein
MNWDKFRGQILHILHISPQRKCRSKKFKYLGVLDKSHAIKLIAHTEICLNVHGVTPPLGNNPVTQKSAKLNYFDKLLINNLSITRYNLVSVKFTSW